jgi:DNA-binding beta-propeller fold protein YncE
MHRIPFVRTLPLTPAILIALSSLTACSPDSGMMGRQADGRFVVSSGQRIGAGDIAFDGRPSDMALHPTLDLLAVLSQNEVFLCSPKGVVARTRASLGSDEKRESINAGFRGVAWTRDSRNPDRSADGSRFVVSTDHGSLQEFLVEDSACVPKAKIRLTPPGVTKNAVPGGMCVTKDGAMLYVAAAGLDEVVEIDLATGKRTRGFPVGALPFEVRLSEDEHQLIVSNWGGRRPVAGDRTANSADEKIVVDERGAPASGTVTIIQRAGGDSFSVDVGIHPTSIAVKGEKAFVANAMSDSVSEIDLRAGRVSRTIPLTWNGLRVVGAMPNALAFRGDTLYACDGGDNAVAEIDLSSGAVRGFRPAGYFPCAVHLAADGARAYVLNSKGNGSVANTIKGNPGSPHDFQGTISVLDLAKPLAGETATVARDNRWESLGDPRPDHPVYRGAIKHVLYIIKENQTYDSIFGDMGVGNGDPSLCIIGEKVMPNHRKIAREFTLFDNGYVSGTNSADGHAWSTQSIANDYLEHFYVGYSRTYPDDGDCAMSISNGGCLWDAAVAKGRSVRVYGEFCDDALAEYSPRRPKDWFEAWNDYVGGKHEFTFTAHTRVAGLKPYICPTVHYWPLIQSDQSRADEFIREYDAFVKADKVPDLMILSLPSDHGEGTNPEYPTIRSMHADNDLAFGRVVEAITHSPQWKETAIFCIEDDGQASPDHVDGHRVPFYVISPYTRRGSVDSSLYTTTNMIRSMELILGLDPMTRFDALAAPITTCFTSEPDLTPYVHAPNNVPLGERQPAASTQSAEYREWAERSAKLNWESIDGADPYWYSRIQWFTYTNGERPFPKTPGQPAAPRGDDAPDDD